MNIRKEYVLKIPIYGYSGMGYDRMRSVEKRFTEGELQKAVKVLKRYQRWYDRSRIPLDQQYITGSSYEEQLNRELSDNVSFTINGKPHLYLQTTSFQESLLF